MFGRLRVRVLKTVAVVCIAMGLSVSLVITTPQNAQAFAPAAVALAGPAVLGATPVVLGAVGTGVLVASGVGLLAVAAGFMMAAHANGVFQFPWEDPKNPINNTDKDVGLDQDKPTTKAGRHWLTNKDMKISNIRPVDNPLYFHVAHLSAQYVGANPTQYGNMALVARAENRCKPDNGPVYTRSQDISSLWTWDKIQAKTVNTVELKCGNGETIVGTTVRPLTQPEWDQIVGTATLGTNDHRSGPDKELWWKRKGSPLDNPKMQTTVNCVAPDGTRSQLTAETVATTGEIEIPSCAAAGLGVAENIVTNFLEGERIRGNPMIDLRQGDKAYTNCDPVFGQICKMEIRVDGQPCTVGSPQCANWPSIRDQDPARVQCTYGGNVVHISACGVMENAYHTGGSPVVEENIDGDGTTKRVPASVPGWQPHYEQDGKPKRDVNWTPEGDDYLNYPAPDSGPWTPTNPQNPNPTTSASPSPTATAGPEAPPAGNPQDIPESSTNEHACWPQGWGIFNPVEWVMRPVGCALREAFVPTPRTVNDVTTRINTKIKNVGFGNVANAWLVTYQSAGGGSGCMGPPVNFRMNGVTQNMHPFQACSAPMSTVAAVSHGISSLIIVLFGGLGIVRAIGAGFGFNFSMGKGGDSD